MLLDDLAKTINTVLVDKEDRDIKITTGCLLYSYLFAQNTKIDLRNKALSFKSMYQSMCQEKKYVNRTIGFIDIERLIRSKKYVNFLDVSQQDYELIISNFHKTTMEQPFDVNGFSAKMYGKENFKNLKEKDNFRKLHENYLKPIMLYYGKKNGIPNSNLRIVRIEDTVVPARDIKLLIQNLPSERVVLDVEELKIILPNRPSSIKVNVEGLIHLIV